MALSLKHRTGLATSELEHKAVPAYDAEKLRSSAGPYDFVELHWSLVDEIGVVGEDGVMSGFRFVRHVDGLTYDFARDGEAHGFPSYKRVDLDVWCRRLPDFGWVVCDASGVVSSRPFDEPGQGALPPEGGWVSRNGERSYVYDLVRAERQAATDPGNR